MIRDVSSGSAVPYQHASVAREPTSRFSLGKRAKFAPSVRNFHSYIVALELPEVSCGEKEKESERIEEP